jgi:hypothetical protein
MPQLTGIQQEMGKAKKYSCFNTLRALYPVFWEKTPVVSAFFILLQ